MDSRKISHGNGRRIKVKSKNRKSLSTLQPSANNQTLLVGSNGAIDLRTDIKKELKILRSDTKENASYRSQLNSSHKEIVKKNVAEKTKDIVLNPELSIEYWKKLAEERRIALEAALKENEDLHDQIEVLETENRQLREISKDAEQMAELLLKDLDD